MSTVHLLLNPSVTTKRRAAVDAAISRALTARGHDVVELRPPSREAIASTVTEARRAGVTRLLIAGGDGLVHYSLPAISGSDIAVGIVPVGTGNDFARALGIPTDIEDAVEAALAEPVAVDLISTGSGHLAASVLTGGFSARVTERANEVRFPPGQQRYTVASLIELRKLKPTELELTVDGERHRLSASLFAVANTRYFGGGMAICPDARPDDGLLDVTVVGSTSRFEFARVLPTVFSGRHVRHPAVSVFRGHTIELSTSAELWADGERLDRKNGDLTTTLTAAPGALRVAGSLGS